jgi:hypothetical protein
MRGAALSTVLECRRGGMYSGDSKKRTAWKGTTAIPEPELVSLCSRALVIVSATVWLLHFQEFPLNFVQKALRLRVSTAFLPPLRSLHTIVKDSKADRKFLQNEQTKTKLNTEAW